VDRGVVLSAPGAVALEDVQVDEPGAGEVLVRIEATGVCHSDLHVLETGLGHRLPVLLGHEGAGVVEAAGEGVELAPGDRVVLGWRSPCGRCRWCALGRPRLCRRTPRAQRLSRMDGTRLAQAFVTGSFATRTVVPAVAAVKVPDELPFEQACLIGCALVTGVGSVLNTARVWAGARVAVIGCGAVGIAVIQGARLAEAGEIHAIDLDPRKLELARQFGATHSGVPEEKMDFVFDVVGRGETTEQAVAMLEHAGTVVLIGMAGGKAELDLGALFVRRARILVSHGGDHLPAEDFPLLAQWTLEGKLDLAGMVTRVAPLDEWESAFAAMRDGETIRTVLRP
jgi:S-(hydroxymethyl)mycothiol dehydrogenase